MTLHDSVIGTADLSQLALDVAGQLHPNDMVCRVTQLAAKLVDCAAADLIRINDGGQLRITASSDPGLSELTEKVWRRWPHTATHAQDTGRDPDIMLQRSSNYQQQLRSSTGIVHELIVPLVAGQTDHGYLRFLFAQPDSAAADRGLITAFCAHAAIALDRAALITQVQNLKTALDGNREIGAAVGVLMVRYQLTYDNGLERLKTNSQNTNRKLRDVAADVLRTGQLPSDPAAPPDRIMR